MDEQTLSGEVIHAIDANQQGEYDLQDELATLAESHRILVLREGGHPSWFERISSFLRRKPIEAVTLVTDSTAGEGERLELPVQETDLTNVFVERGLD